jgi:hypothetical protein
MRGDSSEIRSDHGLWSREAGEYCSKFFNAASQLQGIRPSTGFASRVTAVWTDARVGQDIKLLKTKWTVRTLPCMAAHGAVMLIGCRHQSPCFGRECP